MIAIDLINATNEPNTPQAVQLESWLHTTLQNLETPIDANITELCIRIVDKTESAYLNETFRQKQGPTNILSFHYDQDDHEPTESLGDLAICAEIVNSEAKIQHKTPEEHWAHIVIHGVLHLLGYDHIKDQDAEKMEALEIKILKQLGYTNPYEDRL